VSLAKGGTSKNRPSPHLHKVSIRSNKVSPLNFQTAVIFKKKLVDTSVAHDRCLEGFVYPWLDFCDIQQDSVTALSMRKLEVVEPCSLLCTNWSKISRTFITP
jgi:hypothetical protein